MKGSDGTMLILTLHHCMYDAWSLPLLVGDLLAEYAGERANIYAGIEPVLAVFDVSREMIQEHWKALRDVKPCCITPAITDISTRDTFVQHKISADVPALRSQEAGVSLPEYIMGAWAHTLAKHTQTDIPTFGIFHHGRNVAIDNVDQLAAPCLNLLPLTVSIGVDVRHTAVNVRKMLSSRRPLEQVSVAAVNAALDLDKQPRFNTHLNIVVANNSTAPAQLEQITNAGLELLGQRGTRNIPKSWDDWARYTCLAKSNISVDVHVNQGTLALALRCNENMLNQDAAARILDEFAILCNT